MRKIHIFILSIIMLFFNGIASASDENLPVRVGISNNNFKTYLYNEIQFNNADNLKVMDSATGYILPVEKDKQTVKITSENNLFRIYADEELRARNLTGPILISSYDGVVSVKDLKRKGKQALYRGYIEIIRSEKDITKFAVVNVLSLKDYLKGVVPNEMPVRFGLEALKAQTVAARNYAVAPRVKAYKEFDLCDSVACQVYYGANTEDELSDKAIEQTDGIIALDKDNKPILALYSSTAGGYTESYSYAFSDPSTKQFPSNDIHYLTAMPDSEEFPSLETEEEAEKFYTSQPEAFDDMSPYYRWSKEFTVKELEDVLSKSIPAQSKTGFISPKIEEGEDLGKLLSIRPLKRGKSGKIIELEIKTDKKLLVVQKELVIRRCFLKNGISLPSANFVISYIDSEEPVYKFSGGGFGHGVGLSQWGAGKMASLGYSYDKILQHYYQGIKLATIPKKLYAGSVFEDTFYSDGEEAFVFIENSSKVNDIKIVINDKEVPVKLKEINIIDISKHLKKGVNNISYAIIDEDADKDKYVTVFTQIKGAEDE